MNFKKKDNKSQLLPPLKHNKKSSTDIEWSKRHCFVILKGKTMRLSSDFKLFQRYCYQSLTRVDRIIDILEQLLTTYCIEMAIVDGQYLVALAMRDDDPTNDELFEALTNKLELKLKIYTIANASSRMKVKAINTIQSAVRRWLYQVKRHIKHARINAVISIQSCIRSFLSRAYIKKHPPLLPVYYQDHWISNQTKLTSPSSSSVPTASHSSDSPETSHPTSSSPQTNHLILLYIPPPVTITSDPSLSILHLLKDPNITLIFIYPRPLSTSLIQHIHDYLINTLQIIDYSNRLHMIVPATWEKFRYFDSFRSVAEARIYSVDMLLWCDACTLKRIDNLLQSYTNDKHSDTNSSNNNITYTQCIISAYPSHTCKRVADFLKIPALSGHPDITTKLSRNHDLNHAIFTAVKCRLQPKILVGIVTLDDLCVALVPLILNHLDTPMWSLCLGLSYAALGTVAGTPTRSMGSNEFYFQSTELSVYNTLIKQRDQSASPSPANTNINSDVVGRDQWGSRASQVKYGQKLLIALKEELCGILHPLYPGDDMSHNYDLSTLLTTGRSMRCEIESGVCKKFGLVQGYCYIHPTGQASYIGGADVLSATMIGKQYSTGSLEASGGFGYSFPQSKTPSRALEGACLCVCKHLYTTYDVIGYVTVQYMAWWDEEARLPRLSGVDVSFGLHDMVPIFEAYSQRSHSLSSLINPTSSNNADTNITNTELNKQIIYIPHIHEPGLLTIRREGCKNKGLTYDTTKQTGCIFTSPSGYCGDIISYISITTGSRSAALALSQRAADYLASLAENTGFGRKSSTAGGKASKVVYDTNSGNNTSGGNSGDKQQGIDVNNIHSLHLSIILRKIIKNEE